MGIGSTRRAALGVALFDIVFEAICAVATVH
jgi:hypothetical protein